MGKYTVLEDPGLDLLIETHMNRIVGEITSRMRPDSIILRGSFGRGEGSVLTENGKFEFLSDYEIDVTVKSPRYRPLFAQLTKELSNEFGLQVGIRWMRPDCLTRDRIGPFPTDKAVPTISLYEFRYGSKVLWGRDIFLDGPPIHPDSIQLESGMRLLLNRMAESLLYMPPENFSEDNKLSSYYWINKTVLACAESLLLLWKSYHFSYRERGIRFCSMAQEKIGQMSDQVAQFVDMVEIATEFKLKPRTETYQDCLEKSWLRVLPFCENTLWHLMNDGFFKNYQSLLEFPDRFMSIQYDNRTRRWRVKSSLLKILEIYRAFHANQFPRKINFRHQASKVVYSVVPLIFLTYGQKKNIELLNLARSQLNLLVYLDKPMMNLDDEWNYLRLKLVSLWRVYCY